MESSDGRAQAPGWWVWTRRVAGWLLTALALLLILVALVLPNNPDDFSPSGFLRLPLEALLLVALLPLLPGRWRAVVAGTAGALLGLLLIMKAFDIGFFSVLARPFDPILDWGLLPPAVEFVQESSGRAAAAGVVIAAVAVGLVVLVLMTLAAIRLSRYLVGHRTAAWRAAAALGAAWVACAVLGVQVLGELPVASAPAYDRASDLVGSLYDRGEFAREMAVDAFTGVPPEQLLTTLAGKDVLVVFVESYGRDAVEDPHYAEQINALLDTGTERLTGAGLGSRSAYLTSPTAGGGSWLAHATLLSGLWVDNQQRYRTLVDSDRLTLNRAFHDAGWRTVGLMPGLLREWPEGEFYGYDRVYGGIDGLAYRGPRVNWGWIPDQYVLSVFERYERTRPLRQPVMAEIPLISTHAPWTPLPSLLDWQEIGDGTVFETVRERPDPLWHDPDHTRANYRSAIEYSLETMISYAETFAGEDLVLVFLGDHQPASLITGEDASRDVPITIVAGDPAVLEATAGWGWQDGLRPGPDAPVWRMDEFRDEFLTAFSPQAPPGTP